MAVYNPKLQPADLFRQPVATPPAKARALFVHGAWHGAWFWERWQRLFAERGYESFALDLVGHGTRRNDGWIWRAGIQDYVTCVRHALEEVGPCVLVGHSMGGFTLMKLLEAYHDAPAAVLVAPVPHTGFPVANLPKIGKLQPSALVALLLSIPLRLRSEALVRAAFFSPDIDDRTVREVMAQLGPESAKAGMQMTLTMRARPARISTKTLVVRAEDDWLIPGPALETLAHTLPAGELLSLAGAAHDVALDTGWHAHGEAVCDWLDRVGAQTEIPTLSPPPNWKHAQVTKLVPRPHAPPAVALPPGPALTRDLIHRPEPKA